MLDVVQLLAPPDPAHNLRLDGGVPLVGRAGQTPRFPLLAVAAQLSFQVVSGMYESADERVVELLVALQNELWRPASSKSVPPTATLYEVEAKPFTASPD